MAKKILVIPTEEWERERRERKRSTMPTHRALDDIEMKMRQLLDAGDIPDYDKVQLLTNLKQRCKSVNDHRPNVNLVARLKDSFEGASVTTTPPTL